MWQSSLFLLIRFIAAYTYETNVVSLLLCHAGLTFTLSPGICNWLGLEKERNSPPSPFTLLTIWIAPICPSNGRQMSEHKRKWGLVKRLPFWPSIEFQSFCHPPPLFFPTKSSIHKHIEWDGGGGEGEQLDSRERTHKQKYMAICHFSYPGWHLPLFAEMPLVGEEKNKIKRFPAAQLFFSL